MWSNSGQACVTTSLNAATFTPIHPVTTLQSVPVSIGVRARGTQSGRSLHFDAVGLPRGVPLNPMTGRISGRPTGAVGTYEPRITATDTAGAPSARGFVWRLESAILISRPRTQSSARHESVVMRLRARDRVPHRTLRFAAAGLPTGLHLDVRTGLISGTVAARRGAYLVRLTATDTGGARTRTRFTWRVR